MFTSPLQQQQTRLILHCCRFVLVPQLQCILVLEASSPCSSSLFASLQSCHYHIRPPMHVSFKAMSRSPFHNLLVIISLQLCLLRVIEAGGKNNFSLTNFLSPPHLPVAPLFTLLIFQLITYTWSMAYPPLKLSAVTCSSR